MSIQLLSFTLICSCWYSWHCHYGFHKYEVHKIRNLARDHRKMFVSCTYLLVTFTTEDHKVSEWLAVVKEGGGWEGGGWEGGGWEGWWHFVLLELSLLILGGDSARPLKALMSSTEAVSLPSWSNVAGFISTWILLLLLPSSSESESESE